MTATQFKSRWRQGSSLAVGFWPSHENRGPRFRERPCLQRVRGKHPKHSSGLYICTRLYMFTYIHMCILSNKKQDKISVYFYMVSWAIYASRGLISHRTYRNLKYTRFLFGAQVSERHPRASLGPHSGEAGWRHPHSFGAMRMSRYTVEKWKREAKCFMCFGERQNWRESDEEQAELGGLLATGDIGTSLLEFFHRALSGFTLLLHMLKSMLS